MTAWRWHGPCCGFVKEDEPSNSLRSLLMPVSRLDVDALITGKLRAGPARNLQQPEACRGAVKARRQAGSQWRD
jgi:hypothetical protein